MKRRLAIILSFLIAALAHVPGALACAACYGKSDDALAHGMNWGIFTLLGVIGMVLLGFAGFFIFLMRRSAALAAESNTTQISSTKV